MRGSSLLGRYVTQSKASLKAGEGCKRPRMRHPWPLALPFARSSLPAAPHLDHQVGLGGVEGALGQQARSFHPLIGDLHACAGQQS